jgi:outer membrane biosynthesis protein TonB
MQNEESSKNIKAGTMTGILCGLLLMLFFMVSWKSTISETPIQEEGIEVNLGNSDEGMGDEQPLAPGDPSVDIEKNQTPTPVATVQPTTETEKETNDNDKEAPNVTIPEVKKPNIKPKDSKPEPIKPVVKPNPKPDVVADPKPIVRKPVAIYNGG